MEFLSKSELSTSKSKFKHKNLSPKSLFIGNGNQVLEVAVFSNKVQTIFRYIGTSV